MLLSSAETSDYAGQNEDASDIRYENVADGQ